MSHLKRFVVAASISIATLCVSVEAVHATPPGVYVVKQGDSLSRIAVKLGVKLPDLLSANDLTVDSLILPGQELVVPGTSSNGAAGGTYTVKAGDSLSVIASRHQIRLGALLATNNMTIDSLIMPGMTLALPAGAIAPQPSAQGSTSDGGGSGGSYTVKAGDSLSVIARRNQVTLGALLSANNMTVNSLITPGMELTLPAGAGSSANSKGGNAGGGAYTVKAGDSLSVIAQRNQVTLGALLSANNMTVNSLITPGMELSLPAGAAGDQPQSSGQSSPSSSIQTVLDFALSQQGKPYRFAASGPDAYDCSGLAKRAYAQIGINLVHQSAAQANQGVPVAFTSEPIRPGDLVFMATRGSDVINHVGIAVTEATWIQARRPGDVVKVGPMPAKSSIVAVRRLV